MEVRLEDNELAPGPTCQPLAGQPPIHFFYTYFHNSIRQELDKLAADVRLLEQAAEDKLPVRLAQLKERYRFLEQLYKYHSSVEDEVVYPVLDSKVRNVTLAYSVEHQDEEVLFEELSQLLSSAILQRGVERRATVRKLICKVEEIHITLRKHLGKEEEQLLPLLLRHFTYAEQAELVVQFLYCIPLAAVDCVLTWLKPSVPREEQEHLLSQIQSVISGNLLQDLLVSWLRPNPSMPAPALPHLRHALGPLRPTDTTPQQHPSPPAIIPHLPQDIPGTHVSPCLRHAPTPNHTITHELHPPSHSCPTHVLPPAPAPVKLASNPLRPSRPPLQELVHIHASIGSALHTFAQEARALQRQPDVSAAQLSSLVERHRFLRSVCMFHTISEEEVLFPEMLKLPIGPKEQVEGHGMLALKLDAGVGCGAAAAGMATAGATANGVRVAERMDLGDQEAEGGSEGNAEGGGHALEACELCREDHQGEVLLLDRLGRMLADVRAYARRGRKEAAQMLSQLCKVAEDVSEAMKMHMAREEQQVFPVLQQHMPPGQQRALLWKTLKSMPLRLLERVMPWLVDTLSDPEVCELLDNIGQGAPPTETSLVELLTRWAYRGRRNRARRTASTEPSSSAGEDASEDTCEPRIVRDTFLSDICEPEAKRWRSELAGGDEEDTSSSTSQQSSSSGHTGHGNGQSHAASRFPGFNPIDHIFQFHKALRRELQQLEQDAVHLENLMLLTVPHTKAQPSSEQHTATANNTANRGADAQVNRLESQQRLGDLATPVLNSRVHAVASAAAATDVVASIAAADGAAAAVTTAPAIATTTLASTAAANATPADDKTTNTVDTVRPVHTAGIKIVGGGAEPCPTSGQRAAIKAAVQQLDGRFHFLWGIYRAHSRAEDEIVFPALESKEALMNVSHAYTLDHQQEEQLFDDLSQVLERAKCLESLPVLLDMSMQLRRMCAAVRASVETHVRAEERELWPLFSEHFSFEEQKLLVGVIIGRTGAEVLQALLPFVTGSITEEERDVMMESLREATKNTKFDRWLECIQEGVGSPRAGKRTDSNASVMDQDQAAHRDLEAVAQYLRGDDSASGGSSTAPESSAFRPGWEDIFRMNQKQLEAAVRRVCNDSNLEPDRKAYLIQNIMVSRYIVAQQRRMHEKQASAPVPLSGTAGIAHPSASAIHLPSIRTYRDPATGILGCPHYRRSCKLLAPCCSKAYTCRLCHNEAENHQMDRYAVTEVQCMVCGMQQPAAQNCLSCGICMASYYCSICHLYDDEPGRSIYHCPFCNVCRLGKGLGVDCFHCMNCNMCMNLTLADCHPCREQGGDSNCPLCRENLSESNMPIKALPCGHLMHSSCFASYTRYNYTCPLCSKSVGDMSVYFRMLDSLLASERLPTGYAGRVQNVLCNDCGQHGQAPFHFVYHKCPHCQSYNTRVT